MLKKNYAVDFTILFVVATTAILLSLTTKTIESFDEGLYSSTTLNMVEHGEYLYPITKDGEFFSWYGKPSLVNWLQIASIKIFGWNVFALRLPTALGLVALILFIWASGVAFAGRFFGALTASLVLLSSAMLDMGSRVWLEDLVAPLYAAGLLLYAYGFAKQGRARWFSLSTAGIAFGLAILAKQSFALMAPTAIFISELIQRRPGWLKRLFVVGIITLAVSVWWFLATFNIVGEKAIESWVGYHIISRFTHVLENHTRLPNAYSETLNKYLGILPWAFGAFGWALLWRKLTSVFTKQLYISWSALFVLQYLVVGVFIKTYLAWYQVVIMLPLFIGTAYIILKIWQEGQPAWIKWIIPAAVITYLGLPLRLDGVSLLAIMTVAALLINKYYNLEQWRKYFNPITCIILAGGIGIVGGNPMRRWDWRDKIAKQVGFNSEVTVIGDKGCWYAWRCYLPQANLYEWPGSCQKVESMIASAPMFVLEDRAMECQIPNTEAIKTFNRAVLLKRSDIK
ncbi:MAG: glycosyltransferase family 39 protein [Deltaproteobacteria bacterium]|nr:glycosyltransferase family 39 protein [Deltaproteobacteria bacterium]